MDASPNADHAFFADARSAGRRVMQVKALGGVRKSSAMSRALTPAFEPNVIPFIDVLLVLLIIFMVTAPLPTVDIKVDLPQNTPPGPAPIHPTIVALRETPSGLEVSVDGEITSMDVLDAVTLAHARANNPETAFADLYAEARVFVRADQSTAYRNVVAVMDALQTGGFAQVGVFAETAEEG
jgi:biopolymer transport protein ExbD